MNQASSVPWNVVATIAGAAVSIIGILIVLNLRSIKQCLRGFSTRLDKQDQQIEKTNDNVKALTVGFANCKVDCHRTFVGSEGFLRETGFARRSMASLTTAVNRVEGKLTIVEKLPQICGDISREIVKEMKNGDH